MRRFFLFSSFVFILFFVHGLYLSLYSPQIFPENTIGNNHHMFYDYKGVNHVISNHTLGSLEPKDILLHAIKAKLNFIFFTDLNLLDRPYNIQGYHGNIFVFTSQKMSYLDSHLLIYPEDPNFYFKSLSTAHAKLKEHFSRNYPEEKDFLTVLAHPLKAGHRWSGKYPIGLDGIEVLNLRQLWQQVWIDDKPSFLWSTFIYVFNPRFALLRLLQDPNDELRLWDKLNLKTKTLGFLGNQSTARIFKLFGLNFSFPAYSESFSFASNHILLSSELTGHEETDRDKIYQAIEDGHFYFALDTYGDPKGFAAYIKASDKTYLMGDTIPFEKGMELSIDLPSKLAVPFEVELHRNGKRVAISKEIEASFKIEESGNYRIVVRIQLKLPTLDGARWFSWIYTNNFYIKN